MDFQKIVEINKTFKTTSIKGKDYVEVNQRVMAFRKLFPNGSIITDIHSLNDGLVVFKATILNDDGQVIATGFAKEREGSTPINKTSWLENCETSAVGRALGMLGIGIDTSIASAEEVDNAIYQQEHQNQTSPKTRQDWQQDLIELGVDIQAVEKFYGKPFAEFTQQELIDAYNRKKQALAKKQQEQAEQGKGE